MPSFPGWGLPVQSLERLTCGGSALPILRQLGAQGGGSSLIKSAREGDFSMLKVWVGLEARKFLKASVDDVSAVEFFRLVYHACVADHLLQVELCVKYDQLSPNI